jgi:hypothetical protein
MQGIEPILALKPAWPKPTVFGQAKSHLTYIKLLSYNNHIQLKGLL